ncbi:hypothetical protein LWC34_24340 [Kibdelosporangium philippinense]|uniref:Uncharacterized protein n=1 Tax=Kibdelosporangium philippinense TaxID=211113 RepID=A0ABS8ZGA3_9PSEU|nr:hypothetical protein [Kibdelosporangium philippinense]MCE7005935.1 hypothetical protein [Kibdelosporangium philippinense]
MTGGVVGNRWEDEARALSGCVGYFIERVTVVAFGDEDSMEVALMSTRGTGKPDVIISMSGIYSLAMTKPRELGPGFVDEISLTHLPPSPESWAIAKCQGVDHELVWVRIVGPTEVDVVASIVQVYEASPPR